MSSIFLAVIGTVFILMAVSVDKYRNNPSGRQFLAFLLSGVLLVLGGVYGWWDEKKKT